MPLSRLENFLVNTNGNILYVNPSDLDATDSFDNKGNSPEDYPGKNDQYSIAGYHYDRRKT